VHLDSFKSALAGEAYCVGAEEGLRTLRAGEAQGTLYGGCLSILVSLLGTKWEPETEGKLLFLEDVGAKPYQVDRMLWQLRQAGKLEGGAGDSVWRDAGLRFAGSCGGASGGCDSKRAGWV